MSYVLVVVDTCAITFVLVCLFLAKNFLRVWTRSTEWWLINVKRVTQHLTLPLGSGFVSYWHHKVYF